MAAVVKVAASVQVAGGAGDWGLHPDCLALLDFAFFCFVLGVLEKSETCWADQYSANPDPNTMQTSTEQKQQIKGGTLETGSPEFEAGSPNWARFLHVFARFLGLTLFLHPDCTLPLLVFFAFFCFVWECVLWHSPFGTRSGLILARPTRQV